jgi:hypothetical protein
MAVVGFIPVYAMFAYITNGVFDSNYHQYITEMSLNNVGKMNLLDYILFPVYVFWENSFLPLFLQVPGSSYEIQDNRVPFSIDSVRYMYTRFVFINFNLN